MKLEVQVKGPISSTVVQVLQHCLLTRPLGSGPLWPMQPEERGCISSHNGPRGSLTTACHLLPKLSLLVPK